MRAMKYHIYNVNGEPLCLETDDGRDCLVDFDSFTQAVGFLKFIDKYVVEGFSEDVDCIKETIHYYDNYMTAEEAGKVLLEMCEEVIR